MVLLHFLDDEEVDHCTMLVTLEVQPLPFDAARHLLLSEHIFIGSFYLICRWTYRDHGIGCFLEDFDHWAVGATCYASWYEFMQRFNDERCTDSPVEADGASRAMQFA